MRAIMLRIAVCVGLSWAFCAAAAAQPTQQSLITHPTATPVAAGILPSDFPIADYREHVLVRCRVTHGTMTHCASAEPVSDQFGAAAVAAAALAQIDPVDANGASTNGRDVLVRVTFPLIVAMNPPTPGPPPQSYLLGIIWVERPSAADVEAAYPASAKRDNLEGSATIDCDVGADGKLSGCATITEEPLGYGFAAATVGLANLYRAAPQTSGGVATAGGKARISRRWHTP